MEHEAVFISRFQRAFGVAIVTAIMLVFILAGSCHYAPAVAAKDTPIQELRKKAACPVPSIDQKEKVVGAGFDVIARKYWRTFDLNADLKPDYHIEYDILGIKDDKSFKMSTFPVTYYLDTTGEGFYNEVWIDTQGNGRCEDLRRFTGRETPHEFKR